MLIGSVYLLLATNTGVRNGFLIAMAALFGWMRPWALVWWIYGIGLKGKDPSWIEDRDQLQPGRSGAHRGGQQAATVRRTCPIPSSS